MVPPSLKLKPMHSKTAKGLIAVAAIIVILISIFAYITKTSNNQGTNNAPTPQTPSSSLPTPSQTHFTYSPNPNPPRPSSIPIPTEGPKPPGIITTANPVNQSTWLAEATQVWRYFSQDIGVVASTGLPKATVGWEYFTDWDLGAYIQAVLDAQYLNLTSKTGAWGADYRLNMVLFFLENRNLTQDGLPYWWYNSNTGEQWVNPYASTQQNANVADAGQLLVALKNYELYADTAVKARIENIVHNRTNYKSMLPEITRLASSNNIYDYYVASGFAGFWPNVSNIPGQILTNILAGNQTVVNKTLNGTVTLPASKLSCEPLLSAIFNLPQKDSRLLDLTHKVYLAHEEYYSRTNIYRAFSEGNSISGIFVYEWVILSDGTVWAITDENLVSNQISPIVYTKVAFGFLALYNTTYAKNTCIHLEATLPYPSSGHYEGCDENGNIVYSLGGNTNGLIIAAARYAISKT